MGEIRIVGPGKIRGYPYPVCKKLPFNSFVSYYRATGNDDDNELKQRLKKKDESNQRFHYCQ